MEKWSLYPADATPLQASSDSQTSNVQGAAPGMKENVLDVLMYLFETYVDAEDDPEPDQSELRMELARAGFGDAEIERALVWLDGLTDQQECLNYGSQTAHGTRIYNEFEHERLDVSCRG